MFNKKKEKKELMVVENVENNPTWFQRNKTNIKYFCLGAGLTGLLVLGFVFGPDGDPKIKTPDIPETEPDVNDIVTE